MEVKQPPAIPEKGRDGKGRFAKGNSFRPPEFHGGGRPRKLDAKEVLEAITNEFTPVEIGTMVRRAYDIAVDTDDAKMVLEVARFIAAYAIGKPVQRSITATIEKDQFIALFTNGAAGPDEEDAVDIERQESDLN